MKIMRAVEKVRWSPEAPEEWRTRFGRGPFKVVKVVLRTSDCGPGEHYHITVQTPQHHIKGNTFCSKYFRPASPPGPPGTRRRRLRRKTEHREMIGAK